MGEITQKNEGLVGSHGIFTISISVRIQIYTYIHDQYILYTTVIPVAIYFVHQH